MDPSALVALDSKPIRYSSGNQQRSGRGELKVAQNHSPCDSPCHRGEEHDHLAGHVESTSRQASTTECLETSDPKTSIEWDERITEISGMFAAVAISVTIS